MNLLAKQGTNRTFPTDKVKRLGSLLLTIGQYNIELTYLVFFTKYRINKKTNHKPPVINVKNKCSNIFIISPF